MKHTIFIKAWINHEKREFVTPDFNKDIKSNFFHILINSDSAEEKKGKIIITGKTDMFNGRIADMFGPVGGISKEMVPYKISIYKNADGAHTHADINFYIPENF